MTVKIKPADYGHTPSLKAGEDLDPCYARRASERLYGEPSHAVSVAQVAKQRRIEAQLATATPNWIIQKERLEASVEATGLATKSDLVYSPPPMDDITKRFVSHSMGPRQQERSLLLRRDIAATARVVSRNLADGREKSLVLTHLEEALFWATASIAREGK